MFFSGPNNFFRCKQIPVPVRYRYSTVSVCTDACSPFIINLFKRFLCLVWKELAHLPAHLVLVVPDPGGEEEDGERKEVDGGGMGGGGGGVGSGGATLNALLVGVEHLSARAGHSTVVAELLTTARILILHVGPALLPLPAGLLYVGEGRGVEDTSLPATNIQRTVEVASVLAKSFTAGKK